MNMKTTLAALQGVTAYKDILTLPVMERALRLVSCTVHGDGLGGLKAYTDLFYQLRQEGCAGLGGWLGEALRWSEGPYPLLCEGGGGDPALEKAAKLDISAFELLASVVFMFMVLSPKTIRRSRRSRPRRSSRRRALSATPAWS